MPNDTENNLSLSYGAFDSPGWWLTGGVTLLIWTGLALLLTNA